MSEKSPCQKIAIVLSSKYHRWCKLTKCAWYIIDKARLHADSLERREILRPPYWSWFNSPSLLVSKFWSNNINSENCNVYWLNIKPIFVVVILSTYIFGGILPQPNYRAFIYLLCRQSIQGKNSQWSFF